MNPLPTCPSNRSRRNAHVGEVKLDRRRRAKAHLVLLLADAESRQVRRDDERADAARAAPILRQVRPRHHENDVARRSARHPRLRAVEYPVGTVTPRLRAERRGVGACLRFRQRKCAKPLATCHRLEKTLFLFVGAPAENHLRRQRVVHAEHHRHGRVDGRDLLERHQVRECIETEPVVPLGDHHAKESQRRELRHERGFKVRVGVPLRAERRDLAHRELAGRALNLALFFGERC